VIKCRRLRWAGHVVKMEEGRSAFETLTGKIYRKENSRNAKVYMGEKYQNRF
jgi:hypothetical protein